MEEFNSLAGEALGSWMGEGPQPVPHVALNKSADYRFRERVVLSQDSVYTHEGKGAVDNKVMAGALIHDNRVRSNKLCGPGGAGWAPWPFK